MIETIYAGYYSEHPSTFSYHIDNGHTDWILLQVLTEFEFKGKEKWVRTPANQLIFSRQKQEGITVLARILILLIIGFLFVPMNLSLKTLRSRQQHRLNVNQRI